jgi:putative DNA primase/helicase
MRVSILDDLVKRARPDKGLSATPDDDKRAGRTFEFADIVPHTDPVQGTDLLPELVETIGRYVVMGEEQRLAVALWVVFAHVFDIAEVAPKLLINSPLAECGKTRLMRVVRYLSPRPLIVSNATASSVFRVIEMHSPTLLLDEADTFIANNEELRGILDSGFDRDDAAVLRSVSGPDGEIVPRIFSTWTPQCIAGIGGLPSTIMRRCFVIELQRKRKDQPVAKLTRRTAAPLLALAQKVARWAADYRQAVAHTVPQIPEGMSDRLDEGWEVPLAVAEVIGGEWPERARRAALAISGHGCRR